VAGRIELGTPAVQDLEGKSDQDDGGKGRDENGSRPTRFGSRKISAGKRVKFSPTWLRDTESLTRRTRQRHSVPLFLLTSKRRSAASPNRST
jgi:hypothetical protein